MYPFHAETKGEYNITAKGLRHIVNILTDDNDVIRVAFDSYDTASRFGYLLEANGLSDFDRLVDNFLDSIVYVEYASRGKDSRWFDREVMADSANNLQAYIDDTGSLYNLAMPTDLDDIHTCYYVEFDDMVVKATCSSAWHVGAIWAERDMSIWQSSISRLAHVREMIHFNKCLANPKFTYRQGVR